MIEAVHHHGLTRRHFVAAGAVAAVSAFALAGCDALSTKPSGSSGGGETNGATGLKEAPQLTQLVKEGKLPVLKERIPAKPLVLKPVERIGIYGGDWHYLLLSGGCPECLLVRTIGYEPLVSWVPDVRAFTIDELTPNIVADYSYNDEATEYTFILRESMKWSDGERYTADDLIFWYEDIVLNKELTPQFPPWLMSGGERGVVEKLDDYTVVFRFARPHGLFLHQLAAGNGHEIGKRPAHYLKQFHPTYAENIDQLVADAKRDTWLDLFLSKQNFWENPELPVVHAWKLNDAVGIAGKRLTAERNPYYWKVDTKGSQLPYLDRVLYQMVSNQEGLTLKVMGGEADLQVTYAGDNRDKPVYAKERAEQDFDFVDNLPTYMNTAPLALNLLTKDPIKREVFNNIDFRIGLSHAINRQEITDAVHSRQGEPFQCAPRPESPFYHERLATQYLEYDPDLANEHLDKVLPDKDGNGTRLGPDGNEFSFRMDAPGDEPPDDMVLIKDYWEAVGIRVSINPVPWELMFTRLEANEHDGIKWFGDGGLDVLLDPRSYFPFNSLSAFALPWANWYQAGGLAGGVKETALIAEPPEAAMEQMRLYDQLKGSLDTDEQADLLKQILDIAAEQFWLIGVSLPAMGYGIKKNNFHNVPKVLVSPGVSSNPGKPNSSTYFISNEG
jgi:peptide/nickel transport system substrate-binding protein